MAGRSLIGRRKWTCARGNEKTSQKRCERMERSNWSDWGFFSLVSGFLIQLTGSSPQEILHGDLLVVHDRVLHGEQNSCVVRDLLPGQINSFLCNWLKCFVGHLVHVQQSPLFQYCLKLVQGERGLRLNFVEFDLQQPKFYADRYRTKKSKQTKWSLRPDG